MKHWIAFLLCILMIGGLVGCADRSDSQDGLIGSWNEAVGEDSDNADGNNIGSNSRKKILAQAQERADEEQYLEARNLLKTYLSAHADDTEVKTAYDEYEEKYVEQQIEAAKAVFVTPTTDYPQALEIINAAVQNVPDHAQLEAEKEYYQSFVPVNLYDRKPFLGNLNPSSSDSDNRGNSYTKCFVIYSDQSAAYDLMGLYNTLTLTIYGRDDHVNTYYGTIDIYGDNVLLYSNQEIAINGKAFTINVDVTGVSDLKIVAYGYSSAWTDCYGITDMIVQRTTK